jgi:hypothetical protein
MSGRCGHCGKRLEGEGRGTATRVLCEDCHEQFSGVASGFRAASDAEDTIHTTGWYERVETRIEKRPQLP